MKLLICTLLFSILLFGCKETTQDTDSLEFIPNPEKNPELTVAQTIAYENGVAHWKNVSEISFTFNLDRLGNHSERSWTWKPKTNDITLRNATDTISFNRKSIDSETEQYDAAFINDKFWLLAPYNLVWDEGVTFSESTKQAAPISGDMLNKITSTYGNEGGYTPGDAYDFFYDDSFTVKEWIFRKGNSEKPSMTTTWEDYENFNGLNIAKMHQDSTGSFTLYFTNISVKK